MSKDVDELIAQVATARAWARDTAKVADAAGRLNRAAHDRVEAAQKELRTEVRRRVEELDPPQEGDLAY